MELQRAARWVGAIALVAGPLAVVIGSFCEPAQYDGPAAKAVADVAAHQAGQHALIASDLVAFLLLPAVLCLAWLAYGRSPRLSLAGGALSLAGWLAGTSLFVSLDSLALHAAHQQDRAAAVRLFGDVVNDPVVATLFLVYVGATLLGGLLLGIALWRSAVVPRWAAVCVGAAPLFLVAVHDAGNRADAAVYAVWAAGAIACAVVVLRGLASSRIPAGREPALAGKPATGR